TRDDGQTRRQLHNGVVNDPESLDTDFLEHRSLSCWLTPLSMCVHGIPGPRPRSAAVLTPPSPPGHRKTELGHQPICERRPVQPGQSHRRISTSDLYSCPGGQFDHTSSIAPE